MNYEDYTIHPLADAFPLIEGEEFDELCQSIDEHGLLEPIVMQDGVVIDGRNRLRACLHMGVAPDFTEYAESLEIPEYIWSKNAQRRHLKDDQRAMAATAFLDYEEAEAEKRRLAALDAQKANEARWRSESAYVCTDEDAEDDDENPTDPVESVCAQRDKPQPNATRRAVAERAGVSTRKAQQAIDVKRYDDEHGTDLGKQVAKGEVKLKDAAKVAKPNRNKLAPEWLMSRALDQFRLYIGVRIRECPENQREEFVSQLGQVIREVY